MEHQVLVNARAFARRITGVERYTCEVIACMDVPLGLVGATGYTGFLGHLWEQSVLPFKVKKSHILWSPANTGPLAVANQVVTIHDLSAIEHPEWFDQKFAAWYRWFLPRIAKRARVIVTDSVYTKIRIQEVFRICENKIRVAPCGVNRATFYPRGKAEQQRVQKKYGLTDMYALFVGSLEPRKNLKRLVRAWEKIETWVSPLQLIIAGLPGRSFRKENSRINPARRVRWIGHVEEADLPAIYSGACFFIFPSVYEGFGLPVLEAMACGTPVITAKVTALPEAAGDAGLLVNPYDESQIATAIWVLSRDEELRQLLVKKGLERVKSFSWERTARLVTGAIRLAGEM